MRSGPPSWGGPTTLSPMSPLTPPPSDSPLGGRGGRVSRRVIGRSEAGGGSGGVGLLVDPALLVDGLRTERPGLGVLVQTRGPEPPPPTPGTHRADIQRQDEDDEEAQVPGQQRAEQNHALLLPEVSVAVQQEQRQEQDHHDHQAQSGAAHHATNRAGSWETGLTLTRSGSWETGLTLTRSGSCETGLTQNQVWILWDRTDPEPGLDPVRPDWPSPGLGPGIPDWPRKRKQTFTSCLSVQSEAGYPARLSLNAHFTF